MKLPEQQEWKVLQPLCLGQIYSNQENEQNFQSLLFKTYGIRQIYNWNKRIKIQNRMKKINLYLPIHERKQCRPKFLTCVNKLPHSYSGKSLHNSSSSHCWNVNSMIKSNRINKSGQKSGSIPLIQKSVSRLSQNSKNIERNKGKRTQIKMKKQQLNMSQSSLMITKLQKQMKIKPTSTETQSSTNVFLSHEQKQLLLNKDLLKLINEGSDYLRSSERVGAKDGIFLTKLKFCYRKPHPRLNNMKIDQFLSKYIIKIQNNFISNS